ncbi:putative lipid II flippase FtsW [Rhizohabitans arisaemae]|uniref:putative lipid II flippase FtsW n=1 Tax=Rhizohabitans arisaemae TaxID=2720610 RepID=UPI0024B21A6E|nr:putative lipid II flippase FtsW [Rhizohabitans arisaemae]
MRAGDGSGKTAATAKTAARPKASPASATRLANPAEALGGQLAAVRELLGRPLTSYYLVIGCGSLLLALGLMMVLSASSVHAQQTWGTPFELFGRQAISVSVALPVMWFCARASPRFFRLAAYPLMAMAIIGLTLVLFIGSEEFGAQRWIYLGPLNFQPSEPAKLALLLWGADLLARKERQGTLKEWRHLLIPLMPGVVLMAILVMVGRDLGSTIMLLLIFLALLWVVGAPMRLFGGMVGVAGSATVIMIILEPFRLSRIQGWQDPWKYASSDGFQLVQGLMAMGSGKWFGRGLGASRAKWNYVPHAETDFIFSILGEELGLLGTLVVVGLYGLLGYAGLRIAARADDTFVRLAAAAATAWITGQAIVNIGAVIGLLPITGIPLPLVSYGGSALLPTLAALGMLLSFAKREPGAQAALDARGPGPLARALSWLGVRTGKPRIPGAPQDPRSANAKGPR